MGTATGRTSFGVEFPGSMSLPERIEFARAAEAHGFDFVIAPDVNDPDPFVTCAMAAHATERLVVATSVVQIGPRSVPMIAAGAATVEAIGPGRFILGVGVSTKVIVEQWHGGLFKAPLAVAEESVILLRSLLTGEVTRHSGRRINSSGYRLAFPPATPTPIWLAALNEKMLRLGGRVADGIWLNLASADAVGRISSMVAEEAAAAGRPNPPLALSVLTHLSDDPDSERDGVRRMLAFYMSSPTYRRSFARQGFADEVAQAEAAMASCDRGALRASVSDRFIDAMVLIGSREHIDAGLRSFADAGISHLVVSPLDPERASTVLQLRPDEASHR